ncbi:hypothetical protein SADO_06017 [Salinisphaera dokdonensis CL-ES53]|uniref:EamA domain-containing protein n=1 Tax=Salinisphaera dokdonensis CL-ES53 TaxID=1304272 RepID=A0ABV2AYS5_9GAMM
MLRWIAAPQNQPIVLMVLSSFLISIGDALVHGFGGQIGIGQIFVMRGLFALPLLLLIIRVWGSSLRPHRPGWLVIRSLLMVAMWCLFYMALPTVGLALASAGLYTFPLILALLGWMAGTQSVSRHTIAALVLGFGGAVMVVQPAGAFSAASLLPIGAAACYALQALITRYRCASESPWTMALGMNLALALAGAILLGITAIGAPINTTNPGIALLAKDWHTPDMSLWLVMAMLAAIAVAGSATMAMAYQNGDPPTIATFDYTHLLFAAAWGALFFDERIGLMTLGGMIAIACAGIVTLRHQRTSPRVTQRPWRAQPARAREWANRYSGHPIASTSGPL